MTPKSTRSPLRRLRLLAVPLALAGLAACATPYTANVKRFATQMPAPAGQTYAIVADDPRDAGGIEFGQYANFVAGQMSRLGYVRTDPSHAAMIVRLDYGVDQGRDRVRSTGFGGDPFWSPWRTRRTVFLPSSGAIDMRTVSPELPGKPVNIASTR